MEKVNITEIKRSPREYYRHFQSHSFSSVNEMWYNIKEEITKTIQNHVLTKRTLARQTHPWVDGNISKATRRKLRAFRKAKRTSNPADWKRYRNIKHKLRGNYDQPIGNT